MGTAGRVAPGQTYPAGPASRCRAGLCLQEAWLSGVSCRCCTADIGTPMWSPSQLYEAQVLKIRLANPHLGTHQTLSRLFCHFKHQPFLFKLNCSNSYLYLSLCLALGFLLPAAQTSGCSWAAVLCLAVALMVHSSPCQAAGRQRCKDLQRQRGCEETSGIVVKADLDGMEGNTAMLRAWGGLRH